MIVIDAAEDPGKHNGAEPISEWPVLSQQRVTDFADAGDDRNPLQISAAEPIPGGVQVRTNLI